MITKMDYKRVTGYMVRYSTKDGRQSKLFSVSTYNSWDAAYKAACQYILDNESKISKRTKRRPRMKYKRNTTSVVGVREVHDRQNRLCGYQAFWSHKPFKQRNKTFSIEIHGHKAFDMAVKCRKNEERKIKQELGL